MLSEKLHNLLILILTTLVFTTPTCPYCNWSCHTLHQCLQHSLLTFILSCEVPHDLWPLSICSVSLPHSLHLNPVSGVGLEGGQSVGGVTVGRLGDIEGDILGGMGHSEGVALGVAGWPGDTQSGVCPACQGQGGEGHFSSWIEKISSELESNPIITKNTYSYISEQEHDCKNIQWQGIRVQ